MMMSREDTLHAVTVLSCAANGVLKMSNDIPELVEFSRNLGVIRSEEGKLTFVFSSRSSVESQLDFSIRELDLLAAATGCKTRHYSRYPGWNYAQNSDLRASPGAVTATPTPTPAPSVMCAPA